jgi:hypothetical protein
MEGEPYRYVPGTPLERYDRDAYLRGEPLPQNRGSYTSTTTQVVEEEAQERQVIATDDSLLRKRRTWLIVA